MAHLSEKYSFSGVLSRNSTYRTDCRGALKGTGIYDAAATILAAIQDRDKITNQGALVKGLTQAQRVPTYFLDHADKKVGKKNFEVGYIPYRNQAHHVVPVEVFYAPSWTTPHLRIVLASGYDINNAENIILLPQCYGQAYLCDYHGLPDHSRGHDKYNDKVVSECDEVFDLADEALAEKDCKKKKDLRKQIYDKLKQIESTNFKALRARAGKPMQ